ncbi:MAG: TlpA disulfide reductase family protein [Spongiibacteraceae bacterium]|nr:TlpA disulfide reductase family protein [Spongiibacteraceae bacterium]
MKRFFLALLTLPLTLLLMACSEPDYHTLDGNHGDFADLRGRHILINYWAAWCKPCISELPELNRFAAAHGDRVAVFAINYDGIDETLLRQQVSELNIAFPVLLADPAEQLGYQRPQVLPTTVVIGPDGAVLELLQGPQTEASLAAAVGFELPADDEVLP